MPMYVNPLSDAGFKALLCDPANKAELIRFLNVFLPEDRRVADLEYAATEFPGITLANKASLVDLRCTDKDGRNFIVEVQRSPQPNISAAASITRPESMHWVPEKETGSSTTSFPSTLSRCSTEISVSTVRIPNGTADTYHHTPSGKWRADRLKMRLFRLYL